MGNHLFRKRRDQGRFRDVSQAGSGLELHRPFLGTPVFFDYDRDGLLDLFLDQRRCLYDGTRTPSFPVAEDGLPLLRAAIRTRSPGTSFPRRERASMLYRNLGATASTDVSKRRAWSTSRGPATRRPIDDFNENGLPDLYVLNMQATTTTTTRISEGKRFVDRSRRALPEDAVGHDGGRSQLDYNNDGDGWTSHADRHALRHEHGRHRRPEREKLRSRSMRWPDTTAAGR